MNRRFTFFVTSFLLGFCLVFFITCKKEYSYEGSGSPPLVPTPVGNASFTLNGTPNNCQDPNVNGTYVSRVPLHSLNTVEIKVNVTVIGNYSLTTDTINGIWFSKTGTFTSTGNQIITLNANGTPEFAKNIIFTLLTRSSSCTFKLTIANPEPLAVYVLESGTGNPNPCIATISGTYTTGIPLNNSNTVSVRVHVVTHGNFTIATNTVNGMTFSYTGNFTSIGSQDVILEGSGTPVARGKYTLIPEIVGPHPIGGESCAFFITVN